MNTVLQAKWPAPASVKTAISTRQGGCSEGVYASLNLGSHVADNVQDVAKNRASWQVLAGLSSEPCWLHQVHGTLCVDLAGVDLATSPLTADAAYSAQLHQVVTVLTADCLPVLFCDAKGTQVAAAHAGWRGLCEGVLENTVAMFKGGSEVLAWLGPAIGPTAFEVGAEVREAFLAKQAHAEQAFQPITTKEKKWRADLYQLARLRLEAVGVRLIFGGDFCTYTESERFFSYRRDGQTGRMASCIWLE